MTHGSASQHEVNPPSRTPKPYIRPTLVVYGSIAKLTQGGMGSGVDGGLDPSMQMMCL